VAYAQTGWAVPHKAAQFSLNLREIRYYRPLAANKGSASLNTVEPHNSAMVIGIKNLPQVALDAARRVSHLSFALAAAFEGFTVPGFRTKTLKSGLMREGGYRKGPARNEKERMRHVRNHPTRSQPVGG
jgi:hypothetical protein